MKVSLTIEELEKLLMQQLSFFGGHSSPEKWIGLALERTEKCFASIKNKYYSQDGEVIFHPYQSAQYAQFLYYLSNTAFKNGDIETAEKVYYLNKMMNSVDWFYEIELPECFFSDHALGSVMGRASYGNRFAFVQGCIVGQNKNKYPTLGENILMHPYSAIIGDCVIGDNVEISIGTVIRDTNIPSNSIVFGQSPELKIVRKSEEEMMERIQLFR